MFLIPQTSFHKRFRGAEPGFGASYAGPGCGASHPRAGFGASYAGPGCGASHPRAVSLIPQTSFHKRHSTNVSGGRVQGSTLRTMGTASPECIRGMNITYEIQHLTYPIRTYCLTSTSHRCILGTGPAHGSGRCIYHSTNVIPQTFSGSKAGTPNMHSPNVIPDPGPWGSRAPSEPGGTPTRSTNVRSQTGLSNQRRNSHYV